MEGENGIKRGWKRMSETERNVGVNESIDEQRKGGRKSLTFIYYNLQQRLLSFISFRAP
jgi:hypothetical protein